MHRAAWLAVLVVLGCGNDARQAPAPTKQAPRPPAPPDAAPAVELPTSGCLAPGVYRLELPAKTAWEPYEAGKDCAPGHPAPISLRVSVPRTGWVSVQELSPEPPHDLVNTEISTAMTDDCTGSITFDRGTLDFQATVTFTHAALALDILRARTRSGDGATKVECRGTPGPVTAPRVGD
jgi:hypothetical protein